MLLVYMFGVYSILVAITRTYNDKGTPNVQFSISYQVPAPHVKKTSKQVSVKIVPSFNPCPCFLY